MNWITPSPLQITRYSLALDGINGHIDTIGLWPRRLVLCTPFNHPYSVLGSVTKMKQDGGSLKKHMRYSFSFGRLVPYAALSGAIGAFMDTEFSAIPFEIAEAYHWEATQSCALSQIRRCCVLRREATEQSAG